MISVIVPFQGDPPDPSALFDAPCSSGEAEILLEDCTAGTRGAGLARAASRARGAVLLFVHADSKLPAGALGIVRREVERGAAAGAFSLAYRDADFRMRWIAWWANRRSRLLRLPFGDQGIFCRRDAYDAAGGFRDLPVCDDLDLVLRLRRAGRFVILSEATTTSPRRYREHGAARQVLRVWRVMAGYLLGVRPGTLRRWYED
jgi:hypothetical protein